MTQETFPRAAHPQRLDHLGSGQVARGEGAGVSVLSVLGVLGVPGVLDVLGVLRADWAVLVV